MNVLSILESKGIAYIQKGADEYAIVCPNQHNHAGGIDSNPSFSINVTKLMGCCLACGCRMGERGLYKFLIGGELDELMLQAIGIKATIKRIQADAASLFVPPTAEFDLLPTGKPWLEDYRGIPASFYQRIGALHCTVGYYANRIIFPIYVNGKMRGFESRDLGNDKSKPKYLRSKGFDSLREGLYPFDLVKAMRPSFVILCEGIFDSLNAVSKGFPALNIFGTKTFTMEKFSLLLSTGCSEVVLLLDNDEAGLDAEAEIAKKISEWVTVSVADKSLLVDKRDLGDLSEEEIKFCLEHRIKYVRENCAHIGRGRRN